MKGINSIIKGEGKVSCKVSSKKAYLFVRKHGLRSAISGMELAVSAEAYRQGKSAKDAIAELEARVTTMLQAAKAGAYIDGTLYLDQETLSLPGWRCWLAGTGPVDGDMSPDEWDTPQARARLATLPARWQR